MLNMLDFAVIRWKQPIKESQFHQNCPISEQYILMLYKIILKYYTQMLPMVDEYTYFVHFRLAFV